MKFGVREICDVVLKAKSIQKIGNRVFYKDEPVLYFDSLKTSSLEGTATTVYAQGGRGNSRLIAWEGERTVTFTMEDALLSAESFSILSGADLLKYSASDGETIKEHVVERVNTIEFFPAFTKSTVYDSSKSANYYTYNTNTKEYEHVENPSPQDVENYYEPYTVNKPVYSTVRFNNIRNTEGWSQKHTIDDYYSEHPTYTGKLYFRKADARTDKNYYIGNPKPYKDPDIEKWYWREPEEEALGLYPKTDYYSRTFSPNRFSGASNHLCIYLNQKPYDPVTAIKNYFQDNYIFVSRYKDNECITEPYLPWQAEPIEYMDFEELIDPSSSLYNPSIYHKYRLVLRNNSGQAAESTIPKYSIDLTQGFIKDINTDETQPPKYVLDDDCTVLVNYYVERPSGYKLNITPDKFGGNFYLEGSTLFKSIDGIDLPAKIIIPNCKIQSNFTFNMASSGDPSTFTFTLDAFPDYTRFNKTKKVLAAIQIIDPNNSDELSERTETAGSGDFMTIAAVAVRNKTWSDKQPKAT